jgi:hypothetical protein
MMAMRTLCAFGTSLSSVVAVVRSGGHGWHQTTAAWSARWPNLAHTVMLGTVENISIRLSEFEIKQRSLTASTLEPQFADSVLVVH